MQLARGIEYLREFLELALQNSTQNQLETICKGRSDYIWIKRTPIECILVLMHFQRAEA